MLSNYRLKEMRERRDREAKQELEASLVAPKQELAKTLQRADKMTRLFWSYPVKHLATLLNDGLFEPDLAVTFPTTDEPQGSRGREQFAEFCRGTLPRTGFVLSPVGEQRLLLYVVAQSQSQKADMANPAVWQLAFDRLYRLECFDEKAGELGYDASTREPEPEPVSQERRLTVDDLETIDTSTREGSALANRIVADSVFGDDGEAARVFNEFIAHVAAKFGHDLTRDEQFEIVSWFQTNRKSFLDRRTFDQCRVNLVRRGILPHTCLTEEEVLANSIEDEDTQSWTGRRNLKQEMLVARRRP